MKAYFIRQELQLNCQEINLIFQVTHTTSNEHEKQAEDERKSLITLPSSKYEKKKYGYAIKH